MVAPPPSTYILEASVAAVKLGNTVENRRESAGFATIPAGSKVLVEGRSTLSGLIDVVWDGRTYALFSVDLETRAALAPCSDS